MREKVSLKKRLVVIGLGLPTFLLVLLLVRFSWLQIIAQDMIMSRFQGQVEENFELQTPRGAIKDRQGRELAVSIMARSLYGDPLTLNKPAHEVAQFLAPLIGEDAESLTKKLSGRNRFVWIKRGIDPPEALELQRKFKEANIQGLGFLEESKRFYPSGKLAASVLGFVGTDDQGLYGLEMRYDRELKGGGQRRKLLTDNLGRPIFDSAVQNNQAQENQTLETTLDSNIQFIAEKWIDQAMIETKAKGAAIIVMDPKTGAVLALANRPTFDPNQFWKYPENSWRDRATSTIYEPGSTFKALVAGAALQEGKVTPSEMFYDTGKVEIDGRTLQNWDGGSGQGKVTFAEIVKNSLNIGFMEVGKRLGARKLNEYARRFGMGKASGLDLPGEEEGILFDDDKMMPIDVATMSIGQGIAVTPVQMITAFSVIANGGKIVQPHIVQKIYSPEGSVHWEFKQGVEDVVLKPEVNTELVSLLERVVAEGGGAKAKVEGYRFAGKTGTAEKLNEKGGGYLEGRYIASFAGFGPLEDPQIAVLILIDDPQGVYYGGQIAAPLFSHVAGEIMQYLGIPPTQNYSKGFGSQGKANYQGPQVRFSDGQVVIPDLRGYSLRQAANSLAPHNLYLIPTGSGRILSQNPPAGTVVPRETEVKVVLSADAPGQPNSTPTIPEKPKEQATVPSRPKEE